MRPTRLLLIGTGNMGASHAKTFGAHPDVVLAGGVDTQPERLAEFCDRFGIAERFPSIEAALETGDFDAAVNVTPDAAHYATTMPLLAAGKHVLCEKPLSTNALQAVAMAQSAQRAGVVNMVNLTYRNVPALQEAAAMVAAGAIGTVRHFEASYLQSWLTQPAWGDWTIRPEWLWRLSTGHGSKGVLGDTGVHILDFATFVAGLGVAEVSCRLATFDKAPDGRIGEYTLDANDSATMQIVLENGALGTVTATRFASGHLNDLRLRIYGDRGGLEVLFERGQSRLNACLAPDLQAAIWSEVPTGTWPTNAERFLAAIRTGGGDGVAEPAFARGAVLQAMLDAAEVSAADGGRSVVLPTGGASG